MAPIHVRRTPWPALKKTSHVSSGASSAPAQVARCDHKSRRRNDVSELYDRTLRFTDHPGDSEAEQ